MNIFAAIKREIDSAREQDGYVRRIRVTSFAIPGTITAVPYGPDQLKSLPPTQSSRESWEVLIHPRDHAQLLCEKNQLGQYVSVFDGELMTVWGRRIET